MRTDNDTIFLFTRAGLGCGPEPLQQTLVTKFLKLTLDSGNFPAKIIFYTEGVRLACEGSPVLSELSQLEAAGVELVLCQTCLDYLGLTDQVRVGIIGGMGDIIEALHKAEKVISL